MEMTQAADDVFAYSIQLATTDPQSVLAGIVAAGNTKLKTARRVWIGAPTGNTPSPLAAPNAGSLMIGSADFQNRELANDNVTGIYMHVKDLGKLYIRALNANDGYCVQIET